MFPTYCNYVVYKFLKNGSLHDILEEVGRGKQELDCPVRQKIALGMEDGLEYTHISVNPHIVNKDLKPSNIVLDDNMKAYITNFRYPDIDTHIRGGSFGYIAPEYARFKIFTEKCNIYSFGVTVAILVTGKFTKDKFFDHTNLDMMTWIRRVMSLK